jgi:bifunctional oligoribonuclease and PAP phosphatase NrnA
MSRYHIPVLDSLVAGHVNPDGDSLSSVKAVLGHLRAQGKTAVAKVSGKVPDHLGWILSEDDLPKDLPKVEQTIVLDCEPVEERLGFRPEGRIFNIDHHETRRNSHDPKGDVYILNRCSTASALILDFGIDDEILLAGLYSDTLFMRSWGELQRCFRRINVSDDKAHNILSACRPTRDKKALHVVQTARIHRCRNGFILAETEEKDQIVISEVMETLFRYAEGVCLIDGLGKARLRTSNENVDVGSIAKMFGGGGHRFASGCDANGRRTALVALIKQLEVPPVRFDHEEEDGEPDHRQCHQPRRNGNGSVVS